MRRLRPVVALLAVALVATLAASASPVAVASAFEHGEGALASNAPPLLTGDLAVTAREGAASWTGPAAEDASVTLAVVDARLEIVRVETRVMRTPMGDVAIAPERTVDTFEGVFGDVSIAPSSGFEAALQVLAAEGDEAGGSLAIAGTGHDAPLGPTAGSFAYSYQMNASLPFYYAFETVLPGVPVGPEGLPLLSPRTDAQGAFTLFLAGARLRAATAEGEVDVALGRSSGTLAGPWGPGSDAYSFAVLSVKEGQLSVASEGEAMRAHLATDEVSVSGSLRCADCDTQLAVGGQRYVASGSEVSLEGQLRVRAPPPGGTTYSFAGEVDAAQLGRGLAYASPPPATILGIAIALAILLYRNLELLAARGLASLYTRILRKDVLESAERRALATLVAADPGLHLRALQRGLGFGWGKLHYHLRVLEWAGVVRMERRGKLVHVHPCMPDAGVDAGDWTDAEARLAPRGAALRVFHALSEGAPSSSADVARRLGISRQLAGHHLRTLEREGFAEGVGPAPRRFRRVVRVDEKQGTREVG